MILISRSAAVAIFAEVRRWVERGLLELGAPYESLVYPLSALVPSGALLCPVELASAEHLRELVVDGVVIPPDAIKSFSPANCHFSGDLEMASHELNLEIERLLDGRPRLGVHSKLHAHPFTGGAFLSNGDLLHGVNSDAAVAWRHARGLATAILHVVYPDEEPRASQSAWRVDADGARSDGQPRVRWRVHSWASRDDGLDDLGDARVVPDRHPSVQAARRPPYWRTPAGAAWCDAQKAALREAGYPVSRNVLGRGWRRYLVAAGGRQLLIALPPDLPAAPPRVLEVRNALANHFEPLPLPPSTQASSLASLSLVALARYYGSPT